MRVNLPRTSADLIQKYQIRSHTQPIDMRIEIHSRRVLQDGGLVLGLYQSFIPHMYRWHRLVIISTVTDGLYDFLSELASKSAPILEDIQINLDSDAIYYDLTELPDDNDDGYIYGILTGGAPSLRSVYLRGVGLQRCLPPLATTTYLHLDVMDQTMLTSPNNVCSMLSGLNGLTHLVIHKGLLNHTSHGSTRMVELPSLTSLHFYSIEDASDFTDLLTILSLPVLEPLTLELTTVEMRLLPESLASTIYAHPNSPLRSLTVISSVTADFSPDAWCQLGCVLSTVSHFTLLECNPHNLFIALHGDYDKLSPSTIPRTWPRLQELSFNRVLSFKGLKDLCSMLSVRHSTCQPILWLHLPRPF
jgi:hypothetical protein